MKIKPKPFKPKMPRSDDIILVQDAATYYQLCNDHWQQYQDWFDEQRRADYYQRILDGIRRINYETSN